MRFNSIVLKIIGLYDIFMGSKGNEFEVQDFPSKFYYTSQYIALIFGVGAFGIVFILLFIIFQLFIHLIITIVIMSVIIFFGVMYFHKNKDFYKFPRLFLYQINASE